MSEEMKLMRLQWKFSTLGPSKIRNLKLIPVPHKTCDPHPMACHNANNQNLNRHLHPLNPTCIEKANHSSVMEGRFNTSDSSREKLVNCKNLDIKTNAVACYTFVTQTSK